MLELRDLDLSGNQIKVIKTANSYPKLEELNLSKNPISRIYPEAFHPTQSLRKLYLDNVLFKWPERDLVFLKKLEGSLTKLSLNDSFTDNQLEST